MNNRRSKISITMFLTYDYSVGDNFRNIFKINNFAILNIKYYVFTLHTQLLAILLMIKSINYINSFKR